LETYELTFEETIAGGYIKLKEVEQSSDGKKFAIVYNDDGKFYLRTFGKVTRSADEIKSEETDLNALIDINDYTMCNADFSDPFVTCTFISDDRIFISLFYSYAYTHYHFIYDLTTRKLVGNFDKMVLTCTIKNFPYKSFYNPEKNEVYTYYRQGQAFIVDAADCSKWSYNRMTEMDIGQMYLIYN